MIYLFEDRDDRKQQLLGEEGLHALVCQKPFDCSYSEDVGDYILNNFSDAEVVLLHKSYRFANKNVTTDCVKEAFKTLDIPVVLFSGNSRSSLIKDDAGTTAEINSVVMYRNLNLFMSFYQQTEEVCIPILVYGKYYKINQLLEMQAKLFFLLFDRKDEDVLKPDIDGKIIRKIMQIIGDVNDSSLSADVEKLKKWTNETINNDGLQIGRLKQSIQNLIKRYKV